MDIPSISCSLCNGNVESSSHIFFDCDFAKEVWRLVRIWCDIPLPTFTSYGHWMSWFTSWQAPKEKPRRLFIIVAASFWWIWRFRYSVVFCSHSLRKSDMFDNIRSSFFSWLFYKGRMPMFTMSDISAGLIDVSYVGQHELLAATVIESYDPTERNSTVGDNVHGMLFGVSAKLTAPVTSMFFLVIPGIPPHDVIEGIAKTIVTTMADHNTDQYCIHKQQQRPTIIRGKKEETRLD
ncbi:RNA-directed DNA polymerase, eukaryota, reverse transcriptase zinc-binding domain protein [Tanacetum coccineum]